MIENKWRWLAAAGTAVAAAYLAPSITHEIDVLTSDPLPAKAANSLILLSRLDQVVQLDPDSGQFSTIYEAKPPCLVTSAQYARSLQADYYLTQNCGLDDQGVYQLRGGEVTRMVPGQARDVRAFLNEVVYVTDEGIWLKFGSDKPRLIHKGNKDLRSPDISVTGDIAFVAPVNSVDQIFIMQPDGSGVRQVSSELSNKTAAQFSPDGNKIAYLDMGENADLKYFPIADPNALAQVSRDHNIDSYRWLGNDELAALADDTYRITYVDGSTAVGHKMAVMFYPLADPESKWSMVPLPEGSLGHLDIKQK